MEAVEQQRPVAVIERIRVPIRTMWRVGRKVFVGLSVTTFVVVLWLMLGLPFGIDRWLDVVESPTEADAIVCIAGGTTNSNLPIEEGWRRIYTAVQLAADRYAPLVVFTGGGTTSLSEAEIYADAAVWLGIPRSSILLDPLPVSTAEHPASLLKSANGRLTRESRLLLVTSNAHSRRVQMTFRKHGFTHVRVVSTYRASRAAGLTGPAGPIARHAQPSSVANYEPSTKSYRDPFNRLRWRADDLLTALREATAIAWYWTRGLV